MAESTLVIKIDAGAGKRELDQIDRKLKEFGKTGDRTNEKMKGFGKTMVAGLGLAAAGAALAKFATDAVREFAKFEKSMAEVSTLVNTAIVDMGELEQAVMDVSAAYGGDASANAKALYDAISAGAEAGAEAVAVLDAANKLAIGGVTDINTAMDGLTSVMNAYAADGLTASDASDIFFTAMKGGKTTVGELSASIGQVAPLAASMGISFEETAGAVAALTTAGVKTSIAVTQVRAALAGIIKPSDDAKKAAAELGLDFSSAALKAQGFEGFMQSVKEAVGDNQDAMARLFPSVEALGGVLALTGNQAEVLSDIMGNMEERAGATDEAFEKMTQTLDFKWDQLTASIQQLAIGIGAELAPAAINATEGITNLVVGLNDLFNISSEEAQITREIDAMREAIRLEEEQLQLLIDKEAEANESGNILKKLWFSMGDAADQRSARIAEMRSEVANLTVKLEYANAEFGDFEDEAFGAAAGADALGKAANEATPEVEGLGDAVDETNAALDAFGGSGQTPKYWQEWVDQTNDANEAARKAQAELKKLKEAEEKVRRETEFADQAWREAQVSLDAFGGEGAAVTEEMKALKQAQDEAAVSLDAFGGAGEDVEEILGKVKDQEVEVIDVTKTMQESFQSAMGDMFFDTLKEGELNFKAFTEVILDTFLRLIADMAAAWVASKIFGVAGPSIGFGNPFSGAAGSSLFSASTSSGAGGGIAAATGAGSGAAAAGGAYSTTAGVAAGGTSGGFAAANAGATGAGGLALSPAVLTGGVFALGVGLQLGKIRSQSEKEAKAIFDRLASDNLEGSFVTDTFEFLGQNMTRSARGDIEGYVSVVNDGSDATSRFSSIVVESGDKVTSTTDSMGNRIFNLGNTTQEAFDKSLAALESYSPAVDEMFAKREEQYIKESQFSKDMVTKEEGLANLRRTHAEEWIANSELVVSSLDSLAQSAVSSFSQSGLAAEDFARIFKDKIVTAAEAAKAGIKDWKGGTVAEFLAAHAGPENFSKKMLAKIQEAAGGSKAKIQDWERGATASFQNATSSAQGATSELANVGNELRDLDGKTATVTVKNVTENVTINTTRDRGPGSGRASGSPGGMFETVPAGYPGDSYPIWLTSGEKFLVLNKAQQRQRDMASFSNGTVPWYMRHGVAGTGSRHSGPEEHIRNMWRNVNRQTRLVENLWKESGVGVGPEAWKNPELVKEVKQLRELQDRLAKMQEAERKDRKRARNRAMRINRRADRRATTANVARSYA